MIKTTIRNTNSTIIALFIISLLFLSQTAIMSSNTIVIAFAINQSPSHSDNHVLGKSDSNIDSRLSSSSSNSDIVCAESITICPPPTGGSSGAII